MSELTQQTPTFDDAAHKPFFSTILQPGSSLHPTFLVIVDCAFLILLLVFIVLAFLTAGSRHIFALIVIELCLWFSVKWFINELKSISFAEGEIGSDEGCKIEERKNQ